MNLGEQLLSLLTNYGLPILAAVMYVGCVGVPLPSALLLVASGSFIAGGQMNLAMVLAVASLAAIAGDLTGYTLGRWAGHRVLNRMNPTLRSKMDDAEKHVRKWGSWSIFVTRWLITPLGPAVNLISGASEFPLMQFLMWDVIGEILWVVLYVMIGRLIEAEVQAISTLAYDIIWVLVSLAIAGVLAWRIVLARKRAVWDTIVLDAD